MSRKSPEWPTISERQWYALALSSAILAVIAFVASFVAVFLEGRSPEDAQRLAATLAPFGVAYGAFVTFCTVAWRGSISARQADQSEREDRARLLQEGAKLLSDDKNAHISAGVATLGALIRSGDQAFASQAMNLLADYVGDNLSQQHTSRLFGEVTSALRLGETLGIIADRSLSFEDDPEAEDGDQDLEDWSFVPGVRALHYSGGRVSNFVEFPVGKPVAFHRVLFSYEKKICIDNRFYSCDFLGCEITEIKRLSGIKNKIDKYVGLKKCNLSNCVIHDERFLIIDWKRLGNYYVKGRPPRLSESDITVNWEDVINCVETAPEDDFPF